MKFDFIECFYYLIQTQGDNDCNNTMSQRVNSLFSPNLSLFAHCSPFHRKCHHFVVTVCTGLCSLIFLLP